MRAPVQRSRAVPVLLLVVATLLFGLGGVAAGRYAVGDSTLAYANVRPLTHAGVARAEAAFARDFWAQQDGTMGRVVVADGRHRP